MCLSLCHRSTQHAAIINSHSSTVPSFHRHRRRQLLQQEELAAASQRPVVMTTLPNSAADWSHASPWRQRRRTCSASSRAARDINADGSKSRQISLGRSNLSFIARINTGARWTPRHLCRSNSILNITSSINIRSSYSTPNVYMCTSISARRRQPPTRRRSHQVSLVTNQISRPIFAHTRSFTTTTHRPTAAWRPNIRLSVILSHQSLVVGHYGGCG